MVSSITSRVFISYSHDSSSHCEQVLSFSDRLRSEGVDCHLDQYEDSPSEGWPRWMNKQLSEADYVLVVCTSVYCSRVEGSAPAGTGRGAKWEGALIMQDNYDNDTRNTRFIPLGFQPYDTDSTPRFLRGSTYYDVSTADGYTSLYRRVTAQPRVIKPPIGKLKTLGPSRNPK